MKKMLLMMVAIIMLQGMLIPDASYAASQDECAIWLCLPGGFPEGCGGAYSAFKCRKVRVVPQNLNISVKIP